MDAIEAQRASSSDLRDVKLEELRLELAATKLQASDREKLLVSVRADRDSLERRLEQAVRRADVAEAERAQLESRVQRAEAEAEVTALTRALDEALRRLRA